MKDKSFLIGFFSGISIFIFVNIYTSLPKTQVVCFDCYETIGFPFAFYESGTILHLDQFIWAGVVADISVAVVFSFIVGLIFRFIWSKFTAHKLK